MSGTVRELVERLPQRAAARESGRSGSPLDWFLRGAGHYYLPSGEEKDVAHFVLERLAAGGRFRSAFWSVPADDQAFICEGACPNLGHVVPVAAVPLPHRLSPLELVAAVETVSPHRTALFNESGYVSPGMFVVLNAGYWTQAKLLAGMRAAAVCLHHTTIVHVSGPSNGGPTDVNWRVRRQPGEDEEAALMAEIHRLQNTVLLSSIQAAVQHSERYGEAVQIEDGEEEGSDMSAEG
ncbi:hypothetical protein B0H19DRAFT_1382582 [Mycena capillaripes]|nr:hypothetical protein B0H19DRAFT_1382582 [Mycena capillaripes]